MKNVLITGPLNSGQLEKMISHPFFTGAYFLNLEDFKTLEKIKLEKNYFSEVVNSLKSVKNSILAVHRIDLAQEIIPQILKSKIQLLATSIHQNKKLTTYFTEFIYCSCELAINLDSENQIQELIQFGLIPELGNSNKALFLDNYVEKVIDTNILQTALIKNLVPFQIFQGLISETVGVKLNFTALSQKLNIDYKTVQSYYDHFINFHLGFYLPAFKLKIRAVQIQSPRFYFYDTGFERSLSKKTQIKIPEFSIEFEYYFKNWCISEIYKMNRTLNLNLQLSYLETKDRSEIPLIIKKPNGTIILIHFCRMKKEASKKIKFLSEYSQAIKDSYYLVICTEKSDSSIIIQPLEFFRKLI